MATDGGPDLGHLHSYSDQHDSCSSSALGCQQAHRWWPNIGYLCGLWQEHGSQMSTQTPDGVGPLSQAWHLATAWTWTSPGPRVAVRPPTAACSSIPLLLQLCLFPQHMDWPAPLSLPFLHHILTHHNGPYRKDTWQDCGSLQQTWVVRTQVSLWMFSDSLHTVPRQTCACLLPT